MEGVPDDAAEGAGVEVSGEGVDGERAGGVDEGGVVVDEVVFGVFHDGGAAVDSDFAAEGDFASASELAGEVWLVEPDDVEAAGLVADDGAGGGLAFVSEHGSGGFADDGEYGCVFARLEVGDFDAAGVGLVVAGEVVEEVADGVDVEAGEFFGGFGVDAFEVGDGLVEGFGVGMGSRFRGNKRFGEGDFGDEGAVGGRGWGGLRLGVGRWRGSTPIQTFPRRGGRVKRGGVQEGEAGFDPFGASVGGHLGVGAGEEFVGVGGFGEVGAELGLPSGEELVEAVDDGFVVEVPRLFELEDFAEGVEGLGVLAGLHDGGSLSRWEDGGVRSFGRSFDKLRTGSG